MTERGHINPHRWWLWANRFLLFLGASLILAGIVFFFAFNWYKMAPGIKLGLTEGLLLVCLVLVFKQGMETIYGKIFLLAAALMVGVFLAVFGQIYQTGADAYELFTGWTVLIAVWVCISKFAALWMMWLTMLNTALILYWLQVLEPNGKADYISLFLLLAAINTLFLVLAHWGRIKKQAWLDVSWYGRLLLASILVYLTIPSIEFLVGGRIVASVPFSALMVVLVSGYHFYRRRHPDLVALTMGMISACTVLLTFLGRHVIGNGRDSGGIFIFGLLVAGVVSAGAFLLIKIDQSMKDGDPSAPQTKITDQPGTQWYIKLVIAVGAWVSAICFIAFIIISRILHLDHGGEVMVWGILFIAGAVVVNKFLKNIFASQLALACSVTGHFLVLLGAAQTGRNDINTFAIFLASLLLSIVLYGLYTNSLHRFLSCLLTLSTAVIFIINSNAHNMLHVLVMVELAGIGYLLDSGTTHTQKARKWEPLFYSLLLVVPMLYFLVLFPEISSKTVWWPANLILIVSLILLYYWIRRKEGQSSSQRPESVIFGIIITVLLGAVTTPGLLAAAAVLVLGYHLKDKALIGLGLAMFPAYIIVFYYNLSIRLDVKSGILAGSGLILLGIRYFLQKQPWAKDDL